MMLSDKFQFASFDPSTQRKQLSSDVCIRIAETRDIEAISKLIYSRGQITIQKARQQTTDEFPLPEIKVLIVAEVDGEIAGFARSFLILNNKKRDVPFGWYLMGVIVDKQFRRMGVGELLTKARLEKIKASGKKAYYFANSQNQSSIDLHVPFGFKEVKRGPDFLGIKMDGGEGILFESDLAHWKP